jgi:hypothetical protein
MHDYVRPAVEHRRLDSRGVERVDHDRLGPGVANRLCLRRRAGCADDLMACLDHIGTSQRPIAPLARATKIFTRSAA